MADRSHSIGIDDFDGNFLPEDWLQPEEYEEWWKPIHKKKKRVDCNPSLVLSADTWLGLLRSLSYTGKKAKTNVQPVEASPQLLRSTSG